MKKHFSWIVLVVVLVAAGSMPIALAQTTSPYTVNKGDTVYALKGIYSSSQPEWKAFTILNPFLAEPGRAFVTQDGRFIVIVRPGEQLEGIDQLGVTVEPLPIKELGLAPPAKVTSEAGGGTTTTAEAQLIVPPWVFWFLVAAVIAAVAIVVFRIFKKLDVEAKREEHERELRQDPVTSGPAMVPGGIPSTDTARLDNFFEQQAIARFAQRNPALDRNVIRVMRVGPIEDGTISGEGLVGYLGGEWHPRRIETPLGSYQARYRFPDATEEVLQCLQACMNPVAYGGEVYRGFTFTAGQAIVPAPEPPVPAPQAVPHPAIAVARIRAAAQGEGYSTVTIGDRVITVERGVHFTVGDDGSIIMAGLAFEMTVRPAQRVHADQPQLVAGAVGDTQ